MTIENRLRAWTVRSSDSEQDKQERAERMIRQAVREHATFDGVDLEIFAKGSYANNTNVRSDSDVDIAVRCDDVLYYENAPGVQRTSGAPYTGIWTPAKLRQELTAALKQKFPGQVDTSGKIALRVNANTARVDADVVPCFDFRYYFSSASYERGTKVFRTDGTSLKNYPDQQLSNGIAKNNRTGRSFKRAVRILKRTENALADGGAIKPLPSYFMECLVFNCPDAILNQSTWTSTMKGVISHIYNELEGDEPSSRRWMESNDIKYLFHGAQPWTRADGQSFAQATWNYWGFS